jgi:tetratricopeptide (TPR) repeat protein
MREWSLDDTRLLRPSFGKDFGMRRNPSCATLFRQARSQRRLGWDTDDAASYRSRRPHVALVRISGCSRASRRRERRRGDRPARNLVEASRVRAQAAVQAIRRLEEAVELYGGDFLEDFLSSEWALVRQEELRRAYEEALLTLGGLLFCEGRHAEAVDAYRRIVAHDKYSEAAHRELMRCYDRLGERGRALRQYKDLVELLKDELASVPAPETTALHERLRRGEEV